MIYATEEERELLVAACLDRNRRFLEHSNERPSEWRPGEVAVPGLSEWNIFFTDPGTFEFIAEQIISGCVVERVALRRPLGAAGYEMKFPWPDGRILYVKLELKGQNVFGRSFHFSVKTGK